jgi:hypothetical protein
MTLLHSNIPQLSKHFDGLDYTSDVTVDESWEESARYAIRDTMEMLTIMFGIKKSVRRAPVREASKSMTQIHEKAREAMQVQQQGVQEQFKKEDIKQEKAPLETSSETESSVVNDDEKDENEKQDKKQDENEDKKQDNTEKGTTEKDAYAKAKEAFFKK